jgi:hypothetical protein
MATDDSKRRRAPRKPRQPAIVEIEAAEFRTVAHHQLNAVELTVVDPNGRGYRTWIGGDLAPAAALRFVGATLRLISAAT